MNGGERAVLAALPAPHEEGLGGAPGATRRALEDPAGGSVRGSSGRSRRVACARLAKLAVSAPGKDRPSVEHASSHQAPRLDPVEHPSPSGTVPVSALLSPRGDRRMIVAWVIVAGALVPASGCAKTDWIDRTLVTSDVTGVWQGKFTRAGYSGEMELILEQRGAKVTGAMRFPTGAVPFAKSSKGVPIEGTVSGDTFSFREVGGSTRGDFEVNGDEMTGSWVRQTTQSATLRRQQ